MKDYDVKITETLEKTVTVQAESHDAAEEQVRAARSYHKLLRVARTLADMDGGGRICDRHLEEAICYRSFDRKFWER